MLLSHAHALHNALRDNFVGLFPTGSLAIGDFDLTSDVDFVVVTADELNAREVELVQAAHSDRIQQASRWVKHLEYSFFSIPELYRKSSPYSDGGQRLDRSDRQLWYFENGGATVERSDHDNTLVTRWTLRYASRPVLGPVPTSFAPDVTSGELRQEIKSSMLGWEKLVLAEPARFFNRFHQVFLVLNNCRALQDLRRSDTLSFLAG